MIALYLVAIIIGSAAQTIVKKEFNRKSAGGGAYLFSTVCSVMALLFFLLTSSDLQFSWSTVPYALAFAASYAIATVCAVIAISCGPLSLTSLFISYSLTVPTLYGLVFLHEPISVTFVAGFALLLLSLLLANKKTARVPITPKWVINVILAFLGNGLCSTFQQMQQKAQNEQYKNEFMIIALSVVVVSLLAVSIVKERRDMGTLLKKGWWLGAIGGGMNGMVNLFVMILGALMPVSIMFSVISGGSLILTFVLAIVAYKEKLTTRQYVGFALGVASVILLNL